jgi:translation initiation factor IF-3
MALSAPYGGGARRPNQPYQRRNNDPFAHIKRNDKIRVPEIRVISPEGKQLGILPTERALALARQYNLDLVEMSANAVPPVCRIMDFGKYIYEEQKKSSHAKSTASKLKEVEFTPRIENNDFLTKIRHAEEFLDHGNKVKLSLKFRGREMAHTEIGFDVMKRALTELETMGHPDSPPKLNGKQINVMLSPHPANKRKPKHYTREQGMTPTDHPEMNSHPPAAPKG